MSRKINVELNEESLIEDFKKMLQKTKNGIVSFTRNLNKSDDKAKVFFTEEAYLKMWALIDGFSTEVGWRGIVERGETPGEYVVSDILVYPQVVTGATITPDQEEEMNWMNGLDFEVFSKLRMQGHSHVNMGATPSGTDESYYRSISAQLRDEDFFIFMIWNKKGDRYVQIYDLKKNLIYDKEDVECVVYMEKGGVLELSRKARELVTTKSTLVKKSQNPAPKNKKKSK